MIILSVSAPKYIFKKKKRKKKKKEEEEEEREEEKKGGEEREVDGACGPRVTDWTCLSLIPTFENKPIF